MISGVMKENLARRLRMDENYPECYQQIREALVCEIRDAQRWSAIMEAWDALLHVRLMAKQMKEEAELFDNSSMPETDK